MSSFRARARLRRLTLCVAVTLSAAWLTGMLAWLPSVGQSLHNDIQQAAAAEAQRSRAFTDPQGRFWLSSAFYNTSAGDKLTRTHDVSDALVAMWLRAEIYESALRAVAPSDYMALRRRSTLFRDMYTALHSHGVVELGLPVSRLEAAVYPWLDRGGKWSSVAQMAASFKGRGIVMASGVWHSKLALHAATVVRQLGCHLPIELYYSGEADLPAQIRAVLETVPGLKTVDLSTIVDTVSPGVSGWAVKPYAMLVSSFEEIIFIDADALFFQRPDVLFESAAYRETGAVFFMDRTLYPGAETASRQFFLDMVPQPSEYAHRAGRLVPRLSIHEGESGVIVWDKRRSLHAMLLSCVMNSSPYRDEMYKAYHGDKESYWIAHEALNMPYRWLPGGGGAIGFVKANTLNLANPITICGGLYHTDEQWRPLWFNGGIMRNKYTTQGQVGMNLTHWAVDRTFRGTTWEWETDDMPFCLTPEQPGRDIGKLTADERDVADMMLRVWIEQNPSAPQP